MSAIVDRIRRTLTRYALCPPGARVLVALSGGSDSVALLLTMQALSRDMDFAVVGAAHYDHQLRPTSARDALFCSALCARTGCRFELGTSDVAHAARRDGVSIEQAARRARYAFFDEAARRTGATAIATGHTRDDQVETFLLKLSRGAGPTGLGGIYPRRGTVVRPLLEASRDQLRSYLSARGESWVDDESNADLGNPRNLVRHVLVPQIEAALGPGARDAIARAALLVGEDGAWLDTQADALFASLADDHDGVLRLARSALQGLPAPLRRRVLLRAMRARVRDREVTSIHVQAAEEVLEGQAARQDVPGGRWELSAGWLVLHSDDANLPGARPFSYDMRVPGRVELVEAGATLTAERVPSSGLEYEGDLRQPTDAWPDQLVDGYRCTVRVGLPVESFIVRSRRPGDRIRLRSGSRKLQDVLVDAGVPRAERDLLPIVTTADDSVVWIPGVAVSADLHGGAPADRVILLTFTRVGGRT